jgi:hypothetical protein
VEDVAVTQIQQILWELEMDYIGHPYYVSGNAIFHALAADLDYEVSRHLRASHGMFAPGEYGTYPEEHSQSGMKPYMGTSLTEVEAYDDLFLFRHPDQPWLLDSRPRDAHNVHDIRVQHRNPALAHEMIMGRPDDAHKNRQTMTWYLNAYVHADEPSVLPLGEAALDGLQFGGRRNYGYGLTRLKDTQVVDLETLDYSRLEAADEYLIELVSPFVLTSEYPDADDDTVPWWWSVDHDDGLRRREEKIVEQREPYRLETIDHGQVVGYDGETPIKTAKKGILRVGTHRKHGFGEFRVKPLTDTANDTLDSDR